MGLSQAQVENAKNVACEICNSEVLKQVYVIKHISALLTGDSKDTYIPVPIFACNSCNHINEVFAKDLKISSNIKQNILHVQV
jgi:hypothetical protein